MKIKKIELYKYKRFSLNQIEKITYTPIRNNQLILGRNMSGKSSLLKELSPLPANLKKDYYENGYKYIEIEHNNDNYICSSGYIHPNKHSFQHNGVELNPGGTMKVQLVLVKEHFKIDPDILKLLLNIDKFTLMSPNDRKTWISMMTKVDYNYAIAVYNKLKSRNRDLNGGIKLLSDQIAKKEASALKEEDKNKLKQDLEVMEEFLDYIKSLKEYTDTTKQVDITELKLKVDEIKKLLKITDLRDIQTLTEEAVVKREQLNTITDRLKEKYKELDSLDKLKSYGNIEDMTKEVDELTTKLKDLIENDMYKIIRLPEEEHNNLKEYYNIFSHTYGDIINILGWIGEHEAYREYTGEKAKSYKSEYEQLVTKLEIVTRRIQVRREDIKHMELLQDDQHLITCPSCKHKWYNGYDPKLLKDYQEELTKLIKLEEELTKEVEVRKNTIERIADKDNFIDALRHILQKSIELKPIWNYIFTKVNIHTTNVSSIMAEMDIVGMALQRWSIIPEYKEKITKLKYNIELSKSLQEHFKEKTDIHTLENICKQLEEDKLRLTKEYEYLQLHIKRKNRINEILTYLQENVNNITSSIQTDITTTRNEYLQQYISYIKDEMFKIENILRTDMLTTNTIIQDNKTIEEYSKISNVLKLVLKELSPSEGLIAKSISWFIKMFVDEMNNIINNIWTYNLEVIPCDITEDSDLDYYFKVKIDNGEVVEDISKLSSSGKEIVDLAFRIVFCRYMGLDVPLYLDEFGSTFDKSHRTIAYNVIDKILSSDFDQLFLVCHYESLYGSFNDTDIVVIDSNNIGLDSVGNYNEVIKIS